MAKSKSKQRAEQRADTGSSSAAGAGLRSIPGYLGDKGPPAVDRLIHERMRLGMMSALAVNDSLSFNELKQLLKATDGNLSVHARKLEEAGYITCDKRFEGRVPHTEYSLTAAGQQALERYLQHMEALIEAMRR
ncbi:MAG: transcriptional regulator [Myxococcales bacterium]|nr:transcriptional regulator [Myxococcales bacterium]